MAIILTVGEALVEVMRTERDCPLDCPGALAGPYPSGAPAIFASAAARLGGSVGFVGAIGRDAFGRCIEQRLKADGIDCSGLRNDPSRLTGIAFVAYRSDGGRDFVFHLRDSAAANVSMEQVPESLLADTRYLHIMGSSLTISDAMRATCYALAESVAGRGGTVSLDPNLRPELMSLEQIREVCEPVLRVASMVMPSGEEICMLTGEKSPEDGATALLSRGVCLVALKLGAGGSRIYMDASVLDVPPFTVDEVDPTGAGDCCARLGRGELRASGSHGRGGLL